MPGIKCQSCGRWTNTAVSEHLGIFGDDNEATECYAAFVDSHWVKGCAYDKASSYMVAMLADMLKGPPGH